VRYILTSVTFTKHPERVDMHASVREHQGHLLASDGKPDRRSQKMIEFKGMGVKDPLPGNVGDRHQPVLFRGTERLVRATVESTQNKHQSPAFVLGGNIMKFRRRFQVVIKGIRSGEIQNKTIETGRLAAKQIGQLWGHGRIAE